MIVSTVLETPYTMLRNSPETNLTDNDRYEGYVVDMMDAISNILSNDEPIYNLLVLHFVLSMFFFLQQTLTID